MGYKIWKREHFKRMQIRNWSLPNRWYWGLDSFTKWNDLVEPHQRWRNRRRKVQPCEKWEAEDYDRYYYLLSLKRRLNDSLNSGISNFSRKYYHPIWRRAAKQICYLHLQGLHDEADALHPQPKRLGILWDLF